MNDAHKNIRQAQATQKRQYDRKHGRQAEFRVGDEVWYMRDTRKGDKLSTKKLGPVCIAKICGKNTYQLIGLKVKFYADQLVKLKRGNTVDTVSTTKPKDDDAQQSTVDDEVVV